MNRSEFQNVAKLRVREAKVLLDNQRYDGAYYLLGYALECALKACIAKQFRRYDIPDKKRVEQSYTHDLEKLISLAGLQNDFENEKRINGNFRANWAIVKDWSEQARYRTGRPAIEANDFYVACTGKRDGVLTWLKKYR